MASRICRGETLPFLLSRAALPANSKISAKPQTYVKHFIIIIKLLIKNIKHDMNVYQCVFPNR